MHLVKPGWLSVLLVADLRDKLGVVSRAPELWAQISSAGWDSTANRWNDVGGVRASEQLVRAAFQRGKQTVGKTWFSFGSPESVFFLFRFVLFFSPPLLLLVGWFHFFGWKPKANRAV
jgi:hypothetical protein